MKDGSAMTGGCAGRDSSAVTGSCAGKAGTAVTGGSTAADGCVQCGKALTYNEIGACKKFVNRGSTQFLCKACLAGKLGVTVEDIDRKIEQFKAQGCTLFV